MKEAIFIALVVLCVIGDLLDTWTTWQRLKQNSPEFYEANPVADFLFKKLGNKMGLGVMFVVNIAFIYYISYSVFWMVVYIVLKFSVSYGNYTGKQPFTIRNTVGLVHDLFNLKNKEQ